MKKLIELQLFLLILLVETHLKYYFILIQIYTQIKVLINLIFSLFQFI